MQSEDEPLEKQSKNGGGEQKQHHSGASRHGPVAQVMVTAGHGTGAGVVVNAALNDYP